MRASGEHTPPFEDYGPAELSWAAARDEVMRLTPAVMLWAKDEFGEDPFADLTFAAMRGDVEALNRARHDIIERWRTADRAYWIKKAAK